MIETIIHNGEIVTAEKTFKGGIAINNGKIVAIGLEKNLPDAKTEIDAEGNLVMPGFVDPHVHFDDVGGDHMLGDFEHDTGAAAVGGVTTVIDFAWEAGPRSPKDNLLDSLNYKINRDKEAIIDYGIHALIVNENKDLFKSLERAMDWGVTSFKMLISGGSGPYDLVTSSKGYVDQVMKWASELEAVMMLHTEEPAIVEYANDRLKAEGKGDPTWFPESRPDYAEAMAAEHAIELAKKNDVKYYGVHTTNRKSAEIIKAYQDNDRGHQIRSETCFHYLALDKSIHEKLGNIPNVGPPLRDPDDVEAMFEFLNKDVLSIVSSDHVAKDVAGKKTDTWWDSSMGLNSIQFGASIFHDEAIVKRGFSYPFMVRVMSRNAAETFGLPDKGTLKPGTDADIIIFDPNDTYVVSAEDNVSKANYSVYKGRKVTGKVKKSFVRGQLVANQGCVVGEPGDGTYLARDCPKWDR